MRNFKKLILLISLLLMLFGCSQETVEQDNPGNTAWLMKLAIHNDDYARFDSLFSDGRKGGISENDFKELKNMITAGASYTTYQFVTFENGEMLLVRFSNASSKENKFEIEDVIVVPDEMKEMFKK